MGGCCCCRKKVLAWSEEERDERPVARTLSIHVANKDKDQKPIRAIVFEKSFEVPVAAPSPPSETLRRSASPSAKKTAENKSPEPTFRSVSMASSARVPVIVLDTIAIASGLLMDFVHDEDTLYVRYHDRVPAAVLELESPKRRRKRAELKELGVDLDLVRTVSVDHNVELNLRMPLSAMDQKELSLVASNRATLKLSEDGPRQYQSAACVSVTCTDDSLIDLNSACVGELSAITDSTSRVSNVVVYRKLEGTAAAEGTLRNVRTASANTLVLPATLKSLKHVRMESFDASLLIT